MLAPPVEAGAVQETAELALAFEAAETPVGDPGTDKENTAFEALDAGEKPLWFPSLTVKV